MASLVASHSTRNREAHQASGPSRRALSEPGRAHDLTRAEGEPKGQTAAPVTAACFVYILLCADGTFYIGCTTDVRGRERAHNEGRRAEYTAARRPVRVVHSELHESWPAARKREAQIKKWLRAKKKALIEGELQRLHHLARRRG